MLSFICGCIIFAITLPPVGLCVGASVLWNFLDPLFGRMTASEKPMIIPRWINKMTHNFGKKFVKHEEDSFLVNSVIFHGIFIPIIFVCLAFYSRENAWTPRWYKIVFLYHVFRIGPYFMNFAYVYTLCHKEGHAFKGLWKNEYAVMNNVYNWWIGLFYGVFPSTFAYGHSRNHHKYDNSYEDIITTADAARDSFYNYLCYIPRFFLYAINVTTVIQFYKEKNFLYVRRMVAGTAAMFLFGSLAMLVGGTAFALACVLYPLLENVLLLSVVNWSWHCFLDPDNPENDYVLSWTALDGPINVLNEDYHVVHHQYPTAHWSKHPELYEKHLDDYAKNRASIFRGTHVFELFFLVILNNYDELARKFVDLSGNMSFEEKVELMKARLRFCSWGHNKSAGGKAKAG